MEIVSKLLLHKIDDAIKHLKLDFMAEMPVISEICKIFIFKFKTYFGIASLFRMM